MSYVDKRQADDGLKMAFESFKDIHADLKAEVKKYGKGTQATREALDKVHERLDHFETKMSRPLTSSNKLETSEHAEAFQKFIKKGDDTELKAISMNETVDPEGGYLVPPEWANFIVESLVQWSPIRRYARVMRVGSKDFKVPVQQQSQNLITGAPQSGLFRSGWTSDLGPVNQTDTGQVNLITIPSNDMYALPYVTQDMLEDSMFNVESFLQENLAKSMAFLEGSAFVNGTGVGQPLGLLSPGALAQYPATNIIRPVDPVAPAAPVPDWSIGASPDIMIQAYYALPDYYARNGTWFMNRQTIRDVREMTGGNGAYLWTPVYGLATSLEAPATILGRPYAECIDMVAPTNQTDAAGNIYYPANTTVPVVLFGDMNAAYMITDRMGVRMLRDPYSAKPFVLFYTTARIGGNLVLPEALSMIIPKQP